MEWNNGMEYSIIYIYRKTVPFHYSIPFLRFLLEEKIETRETQTTLSY